MLQFSCSRARAGVILRHIRKFEVSAAFASSDSCTKINNEHPSAKPSSPVDQSGQSHPLYKHDSPRPKRLDKNPPVIFGFIPKAWFDFFYQKTGVTGGYMLLFSGTLALFSKEIIVIDPECVQGIAYVCLVVLIHKLYGKTIYNIIVTNLEKSIQEMTVMEESQKNVLRNFIKSAEEKRLSSEVIASFLPEAKRENVYLQMEMAYRERLKDQYMAVMNALNFQVEKSTIEGLAYNKALLSWVVNSVKQSITPEIKQKVIRKSLDDLKDLASRTAF